MGLDQKGAFSIPCLLAAILVATTGFGIWGVLRHWRARMETQLRLDQCVGQKALALKSTLTKLSKSNQRMKWVRRGVLFAMIAPEALELIRAELSVEMAFQEGLRLEWNAQGLGWFAGRACGALHGQGLSYPMLSWERLPQDAIGPQPFRWAEEHPEFHLGALRSRLSSFASVKEESHANGIGNPSWRAHWAPSSLSALRANLH